jgi:lipopolysaccharide transport system ATP-binding protein
MSEPIIYLDRVSKMYRLFRAPRYRMMEALGLWVRPSNYEEFWPLRKISLQIRPGERLGLIGRNGAGKSTLLKLIADLLQPTEGSIAVRGKVQALMELGTGFHPEFTGRENILSSFAYQGITGRATESLVKDVLDFSELDEFIDKPVKTYSAGMYSRLAFAASTAIRPEILIIDEILGAGDAYFATKSAKRMRELTDKGTTVLFVSHDMSAVQMICNRAVWIDRGRIVADGNPIEIGRLYSASIRKQEELRLRAINLKLTRGDVSELLTDDEINRVYIVRLVAASGGVPKEPVRVYRVALLHNGKEVDHVQLGASLDDDRSQRLHLLTSKGYMNWSPPKTDDQGLSYRQFQDCQGQYQHAPISVRVPLGLGSIENFSLQILHGGSTSGDGVVCQIFDDNKYVTVGGLDLAMGSLKDIFTQTFPIAKKLQVAGELVLTNRPTHSKFDYGSGTAWIKNVDFINGMHESKRLFVFGEPLIVIIDWDAYENIPNMAFGVCIYGMDGACVSQVVSPFVAATDHYRSGRVEAHFVPLMVGCGEYVVSIGLFQGWTEAQSAGQQPLNVQDRSHRIKVVAPDHVKMNRGTVVHPVQWSVK